MCKLVLHFEGGHLAVEGTAICKSHFLHEENHVTANISKSLINNKEITYK